MEEKEKCPICLEEKGEDDDERWMTTTCRHRFHVECMEKMPMVDRKCPMCRAELPSCLKVTTAGHAILEGLEEVTVSGCALYTPPLIRVHARNYNLWRVAEGMAGIHFSS